MATWDTERICPYCGKSMLLGDCPIVATGTLGVQEMRDMVSSGYATYDRYGCVALSVGATGPTSDDDAGLRARSTGSQGPWRPKWHPEWERIAPAPERPVAPEGRFRRILSAPPDLPSPQDLVPDWMVARVRAIVPKRACPGCDHPLPREFDDRDIFIFVVAGTTGASKTTMQVELVRPDRAKPTDGLFAEFAAHDDSPDELMDLLSIENQEYPQTSVPEGAYRPWIVNVTNRSTDRSSLLFLYDVSGEVFATKDLADLHLGFLAWTDALLILVDPDQLTGRDLAIQTRMVTRLIAGTNPQAEIGVVLAKADKLGMAADARWGPQRVKAAFESLQAHGILTAVKTAGSDESRVSWHACAANPGGKGREAPYGVFEAALSVLARTEL